MLSADGKEEERLKIDRDFYWSLRNIIYPNESIIQGDDHLLDGLIRVAHDRNLYPGFQMNQYFLKVQQISNRVNSHVNDYFSN